MMKIKNYNGCVEYKNMLKIHHGIRSIDDYDGIFGCTMRTLSLFLIIIKLAAMSTEKGKYKLCIGAGKFPA